MYAVMQLDLSHDDDFVAPEFGHMTAAVDEAVRRSRQDRDIAWCVRSSGTVLKIVFGGRVFAGRQGRAEWRVTTPRISPSILEGPAVTEEIAREAADRWNADGGPGIATVERRVVPPWEPAGEPHAPRRRP